MVAVWSNGTAVAIAPKNEQDMVTVDGSSVLVTGNLAGRESNPEVVLIPASSEAEALSKLTALRRVQDLEAAAKTYWESWMNAGHLPQFPQGTPEAAAYLEAYKRNLYCVKSGQPEWPDSRGHHRAICHQQHAAALSARCHDVRARFSFNRPRGRGAEGNRVLGQSPDSDEDSRRVVRPL